MSTLNEIIFSVLDLVKPKNQTQTNIPIELIKYHIKTVRAQLATQQINKYGTLGPQWWSNLGCIKVIEVDKSECCDFQTSCKILRTDTEMPNYIDGSTTLLRVSPVNITQSIYQNIAFERVPFEGEGRIKGLVKWFTTNSNNFVYLLTYDDYTLRGLEVVQIMAILDDPEDASNFTDCTTGICFSADDQYPCPNSIVSILIEIVAKRLMIAIQNPIDSSNDNKVDPKQQLNG